SPFKQKTAYEIGLGIPAEPLFRSSNYGWIGKLTIMRDSAEEIGRASCRERV
ncbi:unnamed protein product, partial [marine sediment metagenome]